jgi:hypothetical protein
MMENRDTSIRSGIRNILIRGEAQSHGMKNKKLGKEEKLKRQKYNSIKAFILILDPIRL